MNTLPTAPEITENDLPVASDFSAFHPFIKGVFSQWHPAPFIVNDVEYVCAEQYMMAAKAHPFRRRCDRPENYGNARPAVQKRLGAQVKGFDETLWHHWRNHIVHTANYAKFAQNSGALRQLRNTAPAMLVEANPRDWNWGNGLQIDDPANHDPSLWKGTNLLGRIPTLIREELSGLET